MAEANGSIPELAMDNELELLLERLNTEAGIGGLLMLLFLLPMFLLFCVGGERKRSTDFCKAFTGRCGIESPTVWAGRLNLSICVNAGICCISCFYGYIGAALSLVSCCVGYYGVCFNDWRMVMSYGWVATTMWFLVACGQLHWLATDIPTCDAQHLGAWCGFLRFMVFVGIGHLIQCVLVFWCTLRYLYWVYRRRSESLGHGNFQKVDSVNRDIGNNNTLRTTGNRSNRSTRGTDLDDDEDDEDDFGRPGSSPASISATDASDMYCGPEDLPPLHLVVCVMAREMSKAYNCGSAAAPSTAAAGEATVGGQQRDNQRGGRRAGATGSGVDGGTALTDGVRLEVDMSEDAENDPRTAGTSSTKHAKIPRLPPPLPAPWQAVKADDGEVYYWNKKTNETSWERPKR